MIKLENVGKSFANGDSLFWAVRNMSIDISKGEIVALSGPSGSGKSTVLSMLGGLLHPEEGTVTVDQVNLGSLVDRKMEQFRWNHIGIIFQRFNLIPVLTALENVEIALIPSGMSTKQRKQSAAEWLARVGLSHRMQVRAALLSGGEQQRVAIARALVHQPDIILADEPTANLDRKNATIFLDTLVSLNQSCGTTLVIATHDPLVLSYMQRVVKMEDGQCLM
ncbi:ABC transporter ATP-binding protein [Undibacterium flavidum]|uniref:ABC transporter ATP-binding protein n=1 Tax=Undibacterium flavidum TaxID=2762297 RepID=A0ABR6YB80_9BURK|nr:ABC transporter ATP-binding protein [Undibacterium flavidum]MBC3873810.1 ABC transporter ATP-binding protein [Undibacterium flavidum]